MSSHSYLKSGSWGTRFWNSPNFEAYRQQVTDGIPEAQIEKLELHQAITDYCHTALRTTSGLKKHSLKSKFPESIYHAISCRLDSVSSRLLDQDETGWKLSSEGIVLSNQVFEKVAFLRDDLPALF